MDVVALVLAILAAVGLVSLLGFPLGMLAWLVIYCVFRFAARSLMRHIGF